MVSVIAFIIFAFLYRAGYRWGGSQTIIQPDIETPKALNERYPKIAWFVVTFVSAVMSGVIGWGIKKGLDYGLPQVLAGSITQELHMPVNPSVGKAK